MFDNKYDAWDWGENQISNFSWHGMEGFTLMWGYTNDGTYFWFCYMFRAKV